tara:strand:- start:296 stop:805 length:510 start_codon:yes stop_codon:yes gene_type:complete
MGKKDKLKPTYVDFDHKNYKWKPDIDYRENPHLYHIGRGQQGVLVCEPYKSELYPLWKFKTPEIAQLSALQIINKFFQYLEEKDFVGADMAKKYLHMGFTRARRYYNHSSGKKWMMDYESKEWKILPFDRTEKRFLESSDIFGAYWKIAREDTRYLKMKKKFKKNAKKT